MNYLTETQFNLKLPLRYSTHLYHESILTLFLHMDTWHRVNMWFICLLNYTTYNLVLCIKSLFKIEFSWSVLSRQLGLEARQKPFVIVTEHHLLFFPCGVPFFGKIIMYHLISATGIWSALAYCHDIILLCFLELLDANFTYVHMIASSMWI